MYLQMRKQNIRNGIAWLMIIAMFFSAYCFPFQDIIKTAYAEQSEDIDGVYDAGEIRHVYIYEDDRLSQISVNSYSYYLEYDGFGNNTEVNVASQNLITNTFNVRKGLLTSSIYGNNDTVDYTYDNLDRLAKTNYDGGDAEFKYYYGANGLLGSMYDYETNVGYRYLYDDAGRLGSIDRDNGILSWYQYDDNLSSTYTTEYFNERISDSDDIYQTQYYSDPDGKPLYTEITQDEGTAYKKGYAFDLLNRLERMKYFSGGSEIYKEEYTYVAGGYGTYSTTSLISSVEYNDTDTLTYTYDASGNIATISDGTNTIQYYYDALNQLVRENNPYLGTSGKTILYTYDNGGNLTDKDEYTFTAGTTTPTTLLGAINNTYDSTWRDKLASYDGNAITYDSIGNPLTYDGWTYTWKWGRRMATADNTAEGISTSYKYNDSGIRTYKQVTGSSGTTYYNYNLIGSNITYERRTGANACELYYAYDNSGKLYGFYYDGTSGDGFYYYKRNIQGDIIGMLNSTGTEVVTYTYDTWGNPVSTTGTLASTIGQDNPFRYRGYYYDEETGLYYLNQRYYNPEWGRFISADDYMGQTGQLLSHNVYAYCANNPVIRVDESGRIFMLVTGLVGAVVGAVVGGVVAATTGGNVLAGAAIGAAAGGVIGLTCGAAAGVMLAGSATASTAAVMTGASALSTTIGGGGIVAGAKMIADNISQWISKAPTIFWSGGDCSKRRISEFCKRTWAV